MKSFQQFLTEAPLADYDDSDVGERKTKSGKPAVNKKGETLSSFSKTDRKLVKNPKTKAKLEKVLKIFKEDFRIYFADFQGSRKFHETGEFIEYSFKEDYNKKMTEYLQSKDLIGENNKLTEKAKKSISIVYTTNIGDSKVGLTPWIILHRMGHALNRGSTRFGRVFTDKFTEAIQPEIFNFMRDNYSLDEDVYDNLNENQFAAVEDRYYNSLRNIMKDKFPNEGLYEFFKLFGNFNSARKTMQHAKGKSKRTKAVVKLERYYEFLYDLFVAFVWYAENSKNVWDEEGEPRKLPFNFVDNLPRKIKFLNYSLALSDDYVAQQAEDYMKLMISNGIKSVEDMFEAAKGKIYIM